MSRNRFSRIRRGRRAAPPSAPEFYRVEQNHYCPPSLSKGAASHRTSLPALRHVRATPPFCGDRGEANDGDCPRSSVGRFFRRQFHRIPATTRVFRSESPARRGPSRSDVQSTTIGGPDPRRAKISDTAGTIGEPDFYREDRRSRARTKSGGRCDGHAQQPGLRALCRAIASPAARHQHQIVPVAVPIGTASWPQ